jgi:hypothetical protein
MVRVLKHMNESKIWKTYILDGSFAHFVIGTFCAGVKEEVLVDIAAVLNDGICDRLTAE